MNAIDKKIVEYLSRSAKILDITRNLLELSELNDWVPVQIEVAKMIQLEEHQILNVIWLRK